MLSAGAKNPGLSHNTLQLVHFRRCSPQLRRLHSARAAVFLMDDQGKVVGQATRWVIGGAKDRPALEPDKETTYHFVVPLGKATAGTLHTRVLFNRLTLAGGQSADTTREVTVKPGNAAGK
jgi:hypothetical protein